MLNSITGAVMGHLSELVMYFKKAACSSSESADESKSGHVQLCRMTLQCYLYYIISQFDFELL